MHRGLGCARTGPLACRREGARTPLLGPEGDQKGGGEDEFTGGGENKLLSHGLFLSEKERIFPFLKQ